MKRAFRAVTSSYSLSDSFLPSITTASLVDEPLRIGTQYKRIPDTGQAFENWAMIWARYDFTGHVVPGPAAIALKSDLPQLLRL